MPLNSAAVEAIRELRSEFFFGEDTPLIPDENGEYTRPLNFRKRYYRILQAAGIEKKGLHSLRHTFAANLVNGVKHDDGSYLLMQRDKRKHLGGMWEATAGGSALQGENPLDCAVRELREETGISTDRLTEIGRVLHCGHRTIYVQGFTGGSLWLSTNRIHT